MPGRQPVTGFIFDADDHESCEEWCGCVTCGTCWMSTQEHMRSMCPTLLGYLTSIQKKRQGMSHRTGIRACESSCWCVKCGACWSLDEHHEAMNCNAHRQVKDVFACNKHVTRHEEAGQLDGTDLRLLTIGVNSIFQQPTNVTNKGVSEASLGNHDTPQLKFKPTDLSTHGKDAAPQLTKDARPNSTSMGQLQGFHNATKGTMPLPLDLMPQIPEYAAPTSTPNPVYDSDESGDVTQEFYTAADLQGSPMTPKTPQEHHKGGRVKLELGVPSPTEFRHGLEHKGASRKCSTPKPYGRTTRGISPQYPSRPQSGLGSLKEISPPPSETPSPPPHPAHPPKPLASLISPSMHADQRPPPTTPLSQHIDLKHANPMNLSSEYVEQSFKYERDVDMDDRQPPTATRPVPSSLQGYLLSLENSRLSQTSVQIQHTIVLRKMREALEEAIVKDTVPDLDREVASFMRSLRCLGLGVCREIIGNFPGQQCSALSGPQSD
jgi:hypothetical protein